MSLITKFDALSGAKKAWVIVIFIFALLLIVPTPEVEHNKSAVPADDVNLQTEQVINATEQQPIVLTETKQETTTEPIAFTTKTVQHSTIEKGRSVRSVAGLNGVRTIVHEVTYTDGVETNRTVIRNEITTPAVEQVLSIGTKEPYVAPAPIYQAPPTSNCDPNYSGCVPKVSYDLNCPDIGFMVRVIGRDKHNFDRDKDGYGCESYN